MMDMQDRIMRGKNKLYRVYCDTCNVQSAYRPRSSVKKHICISCSAKERIKKYGNPMAGKKHIDKAKFRKVTYTNMDYEDTIITYSIKGNKRIKYRKRCPICNKDMGYHGHSNAFRKCIQCQGDMNRKTSPIQRALKSSMRANLNSRLKNRLLSKNRKSTFDVVGYTVDELKEHLESLFQEGMSWDNYGLKGWHIDHKRPDSWFYYESTDDLAFKECWALNNLQPLWAKDNLKKSNKWEDK